ncbi:MAG: GNAT family N-acetyltransferase [bacterium]
MDRMRTEESTVEASKIVVRRLRPDDLHAVILLDARITGRRRDEYFRLKLANALADTGVEVSLAAEHDGAFAGFLLARVYYGEFGVVEAVAVLDTIGVSPDFQRVGVGAALLAQLCQNLEGLGIPQLRTEVGWDDQELLHFFHREGFVPANRICLDLDVLAARRRDVE